MVDTLGWITQVELIFRIGVVRISLLIVWGAWFGTSVLRRLVGIEHIMRHDHEPIWRLPFDEVTRLP